MTEGNESLAERFRLLRGAIDDGDTCGAAVLADEIEEIALGLLAAGREAVTEWTLHHSLVDSDRKLSAAIAKATGK